MAYIDLRPEPPPLCWNCGKHKPVEAVRTRDRESREMIWVDVCGTCAIAKKFHRMKAVRETKSFKRLSAVVDPDESGTSFDNVVRAYEDTVGDLEC